MPERTKHLGQPLHASGVLDLDHQALERNLQSPAQRNITAATATGRDSRYSLLHPPRLSHDPD
jgi:hypothetical protein